MWIPFVPFVRFVDEKAVPDSFRAFRAFRRWLLRIFHAMEVPDFSTQARAPASKSAHHVFALFASFARNRLFIHFSIPDPCSRQARQGRQDLSGSSHAMEVPDFFAPARAPASKSAHHVFALFASLARTGCSLLFDLRSIVLAKHAKAAKNAALRLRGGTLPSNRFPWRLLQNSYRSCSKRVFSSQDSVVRILQ
jgi:hypothetical protein